MKKLFSIIIIGLVVIQGIFAITADEIIKKIEESENLSAIAEGRFEITDNLGTRVTTFKSYEAKNGDMMLEFTNPEERGQKILRLKNEIYLYFPDAVEVIHLQGDALKDRIVGSDFSYEDLRGGESLLDKYTATLDGEEVVDGEQCYKILLVEKKGAKDIIYPKQVIWVDKNLFAYRKGEFYSYSNRESSYTIVKNMAVLEIRQIKGKNIPFHIVMKDTMKTNSSTVFQLKDMKIDINIDPAIFSLEELTW
ncbi:MAG: outer membrane lipoprotein-sorting protein [Spirochaetales bacterium]|nr:outer membrane lipoprotein-sorting protein [Spirochaetales bacterium]